MRENWKLRLLSGGERSGKSFITAVDLVSRMPWGNLYWIVGPDYDLPRREFTYVKDFLFQLGAIRSETDISMPKEGRWSMVTKSGQVIMTRTSSDLKKLAADPVDGIVVTEASQCDMGVVFKALGRVSEPRGFVVLEGTFERGEIWYSSLYYEFLNPPGDDNIMGGKSYRMPTWANLHIYPGGREDPEIKLLEQTYSKIPGLFNERVGALPSHPLGLIFKEFRLTRHVSDSIQFRPNLPVYLGVDPADGGASAYAVVACQFLPHPDALYARDHGDPEPDPNQLCNVIDAIYVPFSTAEDIIPLCAGREWWGNVAGGAMDVESPGERKRWALHAGVHLTARKISVHEGENRLHTFLHYDKTDLKSRPALQFSTEVPDEVIAEFNSYKSPVSSTAELAEKSPSIAKGRRGQDHALKGLWYLLYARFGPVSYKVQSPRVLDRVRRLARSVGVNI